jgi:hypothetical protein
MTQHERTMTALSGLVVAALLGWATLRPAIEPVVTRAGRGAAGPEATPLERSEGLSEMRRVIQRMLAR